jgi:Tfp pilus assembly protein PilO
MTRIIIVFVAVLGMTFCASISSAQEQFPIMDRVANRVIQKYQQSSCQQLRAERGQPKPPQMQRVVQMLRDDPQLRRAFLDRIAGPVANKLFECGMIP